MRASPLMDPGKFEFRAGKDSLHPLAHPVPSLLHRMELATLAKSKSSLDRLAELLAALPTESFPAPCPPPGKTPVKVKIKIKPGSAKPLASSWRWTYEDSEDFTQTSKDVQMLITDLRDWHDLTCTDRTCFDGLVSRLTKAYPGTKIRLSIKRDGRKVLIEDCSPERSPEISIECF